MSVDRIQRPPAIEPPNLMPPPRTEERSLGDLFVGLTDDMSTLMRQEIQLAKAETMKTVSKAMRSTIMMVAGGLLAYAGLIVLLIAVAIAVGAVMPYWLSSLLVAIVAIVVGAILIQSGRSTIQELTIVPEKSVESIKEDAEWVKEQVR
jgi:uncharacterized membrane protein